MQTLWRTDINHSFINKKNMGQSIIYVMLPTAAALYCVYEVCKFLEGLVSLCYSSYYTQPDLGGVYYPSLLLLFGCY